MYTPKKFDHLIGFPGLSDDLLENHFTLYEGYVNNFNKVNDALVALGKEGKAGTPEYAEMKRRFGWEFNGVRLHELYFGNLTRTYADLENALTNADGEKSRLQGAIEKEWGSFDAWEKDFRAIAAMRGIGWIVLYYDAQERRLFNVWINEHDCGHLAGATPLLVMDVFEHAYMTDYGIKRAEYIEVFMKAIDWKVAGDRFVER